METQFLTGNIMIVNHFLKKEVPLHSWHHRTCLIDTSIRCAVFRVKNDVLLDVVFLSTMHCCTTKRNNVERMIGNSQ